MLGISRARFSVVSGVGRFEGWGSRQGGEKCWGTDSLGSRVRVGSTDGGGGGEVSS